MTTTPTRLQIAARIHMLLLRELGQGIDIEQMVHSERYERDVLLVCAAYKDTELASLALQYRRTMPLPTAVPLAGHARQPTEWSRDTSGFGVSRPFETLDQLPEAEPEVPARRRGEHTERAQDSLARRLLSRWLPR
jgi:hypothetical protein